MARHLCLVGPTASGKSALAQALAETTGGFEIVSLDSMQVYRGMDIGTATPGVAERARVPHHLVDVADPSEAWSVTRTQELARAAVADIEARGGRALLVGGTGLYVQAVIDDFRVPAQDPAVRAGLEAATADAAGLAAAHAELVRLDPVAAARIEPTNRRRIVRALEVIRVTGEHFSSFGPGVFGAGAPVLDVALAGVWLERAHLGARIADRVAAMAAAGLVEEVRALLEREPAPSATATQAIGYKEVAEALQSGTDLDAALALVTQRTRAFARRQRMWFRRDPRVTWFACGDDPLRLLPALRAWSASGNLSASVRGAP